jgi:hypothetical protein
LEERAGHREKKYEQEGVFSLISSFRIEKRERARNNFTEGKERDPNLKSLLSNEEAERGVAINGGNKAGDNSVAVSDPKAQRPLPYWEEAGARPIWDDLPLHP